MDIVFIGIHGRELAYSRVRCYQFASLLRTYGVSTEVLTYQEAFAPLVPDDGMLRLREIEKLRITFKALKYLILMRKEIFYLQKVHWHAAAPFLLARMGLNKIILDYDDWDLDRSPFFQNKLLNYLFFGASGAKEITEKVASIAKACVVSTAPLGELLKKYNPNIFLVPTGVDTTRFVIPRRTGIMPAPVFIWTGKVWGEVIFENVRFCIDCFTTLRRGMPDIKFIIAGDGACMGRLREYVRLNKFQGIEFVGWVEPDVMPAMLSRANIGLLPLIPDKQNEDWMRCKCPTKLFEYMAMGMPTVASRMGEVVSIADDCGGIYLASNKDEFIQGMRLLARDVALRISMGKKARACVERRYALGVLGPDLVRVIQIVKTA